MIYIPKDSVLVFFLIGKDDGEFHIVSCSNLVPLKRVDLIIKVIKSIVDRGYSIQYTCIGDGPEQGRLKEMINNYNLNRFVHFCGRLHNTEVIEIYRKKHFDLFINLSTSEGLPVSIMEACSFGIPILATNVGGTSEIVEDKNGILVNKDESVESVSSKIQELINDKALQQSKRKEARLKWASMFSDRNYLEWCNNVLLG